MKLAIVAGTDAAIALAFRLLDVEPESVIVSTRAHADPRVRHVESIKAFLGDSLGAFDAFAFIGALGICVRSLAPYLADKRTDPAVVNLDEAGRHVQSVLSGHLGGANDLARRLAHALGAEPVITTASDVQDLWSLDLLGRAHGWTPAASPDFNAVVARFVNRRPTALLLEVRDRGTAFLERTRPANVTIFQHYEDIDFARFELLIVVTYRRLTPPVPCLQLWARALCVGIGCTRGAPPAPLAESANSLLAANNFPPAAVRCVASAALKADEPALRDWAATLGVEFVTFDDATLAAQPVVTPSAVVQEKIGLPSVAEAAALAAAAKGPLLLPKQKAALGGDHHHTLAVALDRRLQRRARIAIVGAGPGDPDLISVHGRHLLETADFVLYAGSLVPVALTRCARPGAEVRSSAGMDLDQQIEAMAEHYALGHLIVRLHTGDPCLYGAIQEQMAEFDARGWDYFVVPGISAFQAAAARLRTEFTIPELVQTIILTRGEGATPMPEREKLAELARHRATLCVYLSVALADDVQRQLLEHYPPDTPLALLHRVTWPDERVYTGRLDELAAIVRERELTRTTLIVVSPALGARGGRSHLYDPAKGHGFRAPRKEAS
jgi:precorrin-4 C11-methyltransferase